MTFDCQQRAMFPTEDDIRHGTIVGAILGGAIAYAIGRPDLILGAVVAGGIVGGVAAGRENYIRYQLARARGNLGRALEETVQDRRAGEFNMAAMVYEPAAELVTQELTDILQIVERLDQVSRPPRDVLRRLEPVVERAERHTSLIGTAKTNSEQSLVVLDDATSSLAREVGARTPSVNAVSRATVEARSNPEAPLWNLYFRLRASPVYASVSGRRG